jgi:hypothetical protein
MILSGAIYNISTLYIASYALRYDSTTIVIGTFTGGSVVSFNIRDGNSTNLPNMLISY